MSRFPLLVGAALVLVGGGAAAVMVLAPVSDPAGETEGSTGSPSAGSIGDEVTPTRLGRKRVTSRALRASSASKALWAALRRAQREGRPFDAFDALQSLREGHPESVPTDAPVIAEIETAVLDLVAAAAERDEALALAARVRGALMLTASQDRLRRILSKFTGGLTAEEALVVAGGRDDVERDALARHLKRFGPEKPGVDRAIATPDWVDATLARVPQRITRRKTKVVPLPVADVDEAEERRLAQLEKLRQREAVHLLDHIHAGLAWLAIHQSADGSIDDKAVTARCKKLKHDPICTDITGQRGGRYRLAATSLMVLAFLDFRDQDARALFEPSLADAVQWVLSQQKPDGSLGVLRYEAPIALMALGQAASSSGRPDLIAAVEKGWAYHGRVAGPLGGFRYSARQVGDVSVTGWYVQAFEAAVAAGAEIPVRTKQGLTDFVGQHWDGDSGFGYTSKVPRASLRSVGMLSQQILGSVRDEELRDSWREVLAVPPKKTGRRLNLYSLYYDVRMELLLDGVLSDARRDAVTALAADWQVHEGHAAGMFDTSPRITVGEGKKSKGTEHASQWIGSRGGTAVFTAFSILTLEHALYRR